MGPLAAGAKSAFTLLAPWGLALAALIVPLILLYILKIKRQRRTVASTWLWASAQRDLLAKAPWKRLIAQLPLIIQALALLLLALAIAKPATRGRAFTGDHVAIVFDTSASMSALAPNRYGSPTTRLDLAKQTAKDILASLTPGSDVIVLEAGHDARVVAPLDRDMVRVRGAIDRVGTRDVEGDLGAAIALAVDRLRQLGGSRRLVVLTDGDLAKPASLRGAALPVEVITVGASIENAAIVRVDVRSGTDPVTHKEQVQAFLITANFGRSAREVYVTMRQENASDVLASRRLSIAPGERAPVELKFNPSAGDYNKGLIFEISPHDAMPVDDVAYGRVPAGDKLPVYLAGASPWIERALTADPMVSLRTGSIADLATAGVSLDALVVVDGACPDAPGGDLLIVHPPPGRCMGAVVGSIVEHPEITSWENGDPRMRFLTLDGVHVAKANLLVSDGATRRLVATREGVIAADVSTSTRTATLIGFDVGESDWPLKASFVLFVRNVVELARAHRAHGIAGPARAGEPIRVGLPPSATNVEATGPNGEKVEVSQRGSLAVIPDAPRIGFYHVAWQGPQSGSLVVAANLTSAAESDLSPKVLPADGDQIKVTSAGEEPDAHNEWTWVLALAALAFVVFDVWYFTRDPRANLRSMTPAQPRMPERKVGA